MTVRTDNRIWICGPTLGVETSVARDAVAPRATHYQRFNFYSLERPLLLRIQNIVDPFDRPGNMKLRRAVTLPGCAAKVATERDERTSQL